MGRVPIGRDSITHGAFLDRRTLKPYTPYFQINPIHHRGLRDRPALSKIGPNDERTCERTRKGELVMPHGATLATIASTVDPDHTEYLNRINQINPQLRPACSGLESTIFRQSSKYDLPAMANRHQIQPPRRH